MTAVRPTLWTRSFILLWSSTFVTFFVAFQLFPTTPLRLRELGAQLPESGCFLGIFTLGSSLGALVTGQLGDHLGHRRMMVSSAIGFMIIMAVYAVMPVRWGFYVLAPLQGAIWSGLLTSTSALLGSILPADRRTEGMSIYGLASPAGVIVGPTVGVWMFQHVGFRGLCGGLVLGFAVLAGLIRSLPVEPKSPAQRPPFQLPELPVLRLSSVLFFVALGYGALSSFSTVAMLCALPITVRIAGRQGTGRVAAEKIPIELG